jgi:aminoglycoside phosphotransferase (APT) family kinase protein
VVRPEIPDDARSIDAAALTALLSDRHPGVAVADVEVVHRQQVTNSHAWLSVRYDEAAGAPTSLFCKLLPRGPRRDAVAATGMGLREARFYERLAHLLGLRVPEVHAAVVDEDDGRFLLLLEDLVATGATTPDGSQGVAPDAAADALADLAAMHVRYESARSRAAEAPWVTPPRPGSDYGARMLRHGLDHHRDRLRDDFAELAELYIARQPELQAVWVEGPPTVIHGDPHLGNLFDDHGRVGFLDWGMVTVSTPMRDVGYFLTMAMDVEERRSHQVELLRHYLEVRRALGGSPIDFDEAWLRHRIHAAYTVPASCQIVLFPDDIPDSRRLFAEAFLERAQSCVEDLEARDALRAIGI